MIRQLLLLVLLFASLPLAAGPVVDKVLVHKHERRLELLSGDQVLRSYRISLGRQPIGHKQQRGDQRTPEGIYTLDWRQRSEQYNLSIHIDYPNLKDRISAMQRGVDPGSMIMIHGTPIDDEFPEWYFKGLDWTNGCIALQNDDMRELWQLVPDGTLIEIRP